MTVRECMTTQVYVLARDDNGLAHDDEEDV
jgi:hypothetical protein